MRTVRCRATHSHTQELVSYISARQLQEDLSNQQAVKTAKKRSYDLPKFFNYLKTSDHPMFAENPDLTVDQAIVLWRQAGMGGDSDSRNFVLRYLA